MTSSFFQSTGIGWGLVFFFAEVALIPTAIIYFQRRRERRRAKEFMRVWGRDCLGALLRIQPIGTGPIGIAGYTFDMPEGGWSAHKPVFDLWEDVVRGARDPVMAAETVSQAYAAALWGDEKYGPGEIPRDVVYPLSFADVEVVRAMLDRVKNVMYAQMGALEFERLPVADIEMAASMLAGFSRAGQTTRFGLGIYSASLTSAVGQFGRYLWWMEGWRGNTPTQSNEAS